jgi:iron complex outermembrane receptor protein
MYVLQLLLAHEFEWYLKRDNIRSTLGVGVTGNFLDKHLKIELNNFFEKSNSNKGNWRCILILLQQKKCGWTYFQWYTSPTEINQLAGRNP